MNTKNKTALRAAVLIHEQLAGGKTQDEMSIYLPEYGWNNIQVIRRQIDLARQHGWYRAAAQLTRDLADALNTCSNYLDDALRDLRSRPTQRRASSASDIYRDILALYEEFEEVDIDPVEHELSVTTDRIVLEGSYLGAFQIKLDWRHLGNSSAYRVAALDPQPAAAREDVTHPHVQDEQLCEGDGRSAIHAALAECRLQDFFLLVSQVLHNYNSGSAYISLDRWNGVGCEDCGATVDEDERYSCQACDSTLCSSCSVSCEACGGSYCSGCICQCANCGFDHCSACLETCPMCHKRFCADCREDGICKSCHDKQHNEEHEHDSPETLGNEPAAADARTVAGTAVAAV